MSFWKSTGFTPARDALRRPMRWNLALIAGIAGPGFTCLRPHYLLDLVRTGSDGEWDWSQLDDVLDWMTDLGFDLIFEMMGNPGEVFTDFGDPEQLRRWRRMVVELIDHLEDRYGRSRITRWYFESWNEPDVDSWWHQWPDGDLFCRYWDATAAAFDERAPYLRLGGPATCSTGSPVYRRFVDHCAVEHNSVSGAGPVRLDFISVHEKGGPETEEEITPDAGKIIAAEWDAIEIARDAGLPADLPFMNNECDPQVGWNLPHRWRMKAWYASIVAEIVATHREHLMDAGVIYPVLSSDNAFLGTWGQRTLFTLFSSGLDGDTCDDEFLLLRKPVADLFALLGLMGDDIVQSGDGWVVTGRGGDRFCLAWSLDAAREISLDVDVPGACYRRRRFTIADGLDTPYERWCSVGSPTVPAETLWDEMVAASVIKSTDTAWTSAERTGTISLSAPAGGVALVAFVAQRNREPSPVTGLRVLDVKGPPEKSDVLVGWDHPGDPAAIKEYEIVIDGTQIVTPGPGMSVVTVLYRVDLRAERTISVRVKDIWERYSSFRQCTFRLPSKDFNTATTALG